MSSDDGSDINENIPKVDLKSVKLNQLQLNEKESEVSLDKPPNTDDKPKLPQTMCSFTAVANQKIGMSEARGKLPRKKRRGASELTLQKLKQRILNRNSKSEAELTAISALATMSTERLELPSKTINVDDYLHVDESSSSKCESKPHSNYENPDNWGEKKLFLFFFSNKALVDLEDHYAYIKESMESAQQKLRIGQLPETPMERNVARFEAVGVDISIFFPVWKERIALLNDDASHIEELKKYGISREAAIKIGTTMEDLKELNPAVFKAATEMAIVYNEDVDTVLCLSAYCVLHLQIEDSYLLDEVIKDLLHTDLPLLLLTQMYRERYFKQKSVEEAPSLPSKPGTVVESEDKNVDVETAHKIPPTMSSNDDSKPEKDNNSPTNILKNATMNFLTLFENEIEKLFYNKLKAEEELESVKIISDKTTNIPISERENSVLCAPIPRKKQLLHDFTKSLRNTLKRPFEVMANLNVKRTADSANRLKSSPKIIHDDCKNDSNESSSSKCDVYKRMRCDDSQISSRLHEESELFHILFRNTKAKDRENRLVKLQEDAESAKLKLRSGQLPETVMEKHVALLESLDLDISTFFPIWKARIEWLKTMMHDI
ncbi:hypothetical protein CHUAL_012565 [Chamberlinius hualienensis]